MSAFNFYEPRRRLLVQAESSQVLTIAEQRRAGLTTGNSAANLILAGYDSDDATSVDPRYDIHYRPLDVAAEYLERKATRKASELSRGASSASSSSSSESNLTSSSNSSSESSSGPVSSE
ncbi:hypothetical protein [Sigmofec virus UA08Rod_6083]|uniref:Uncharacterized protein n=1 Tax=Sigmofec virus UA08Rod_6083 TaxID=2929451 RepID=A0A976N141_9VIRU|nr:hypothetical protein [Sigmofec virus UA08Rod_6083]